MNGSILRELGGRINDKSGYFLVMRGVYYRIRCEKESSAKSRNRSPFMLPMREEGRERRRWSEKRKRMLSPVAPPHFSEKPAGGSMKWKHPRLFFTKRYGRRERRRTEVGEGFPI